jgi:molecular chaperone GrpE (heat shock protein)
VDDVLARLPPAAIAWRCLKSEYERRTRQIDREEEQERARDQILVGIAEAVDQLRRASAVEPLPQGSATLIEGVVGTVERLERLLADLQVKVVSPRAGELYTSELMEFIENAAQVPDPGITELRIAEVLTPAVFLRGELYRAGKAVISVPKTST